VAQHRYRTGATQQFIALAESRSGLDLARFFDLWLFEPHKPAAW
jgi:aminopeptidase N